MIDNPNEFIPAFADAGANWVSVHYEACTHLHRTLELILHHGMKPGVVLNPATRVDLIIDILPMVHHVLIMSVNPGFGGQEFIPFSLDKIRRLAEMRNELGLDFRIEVDGGVAHDTVAPSSKQVRSCWWPAMPSLAPGEPERDARALLAAAREADDRVIARAKRRPERVKFTKKHAMQADGRPTQGRCPPMRWYEPVVFQKCRRLPCLALFLGGITAEAQAQSAAPDQKPGQARTTSSTRGP